MTSKHDDWAAYEHAREVLDDVRKRLRAGAEKDGAMLSADECHKLLLVLKPTPKPSHRKAVDPVGIKMRYLKLRRDGMLRSNAIAETAVYFDTSKWMVNYTLRMLKK
jgi:hypothetical protein